MTETSISLNVSEIGILLSALELLEISEENHIAHEYGSATVLYHKLHNVWRHMDTSETGLRNDIVPSF